jgi:hypothetical protein
MENTSQLEHAHVGPKCAACDAEVNALNKKGLGQFTQPVTDEVNGNDVGRWAVYLVIGVGLIFLLNGLPGIMRAVNRHQVAYDLCMESQPEFDTLGERLGHWTRCHRLANEVAPIVPERKVTRGWK